VQICTGNETPLSPHCGGTGISGIEIYTGAGKGKSTSALGKALQAIGRELVKISLTAFLIMA